MVEWISVFQYRSGLVKILLKLYCNPVRNFRVDFTYMRRSGAADLPLHYGYVPKWLALMKVSCIATILCNFIMQWRLSAGLYVTAVMASLLN